MRIKKDFRKEVGCLAPSKTVQNREHLGIVGGTQSAEVSQFYALLSNSQKRKGRN